MMITVDLFDTLQFAWQTLCSTYDVTADLPRAGMLFERAHPSAPMAAAQTVVVNMLSEIIDSLGRFSPWYKQPAAAFGLTLTPALPTGRPMWVLTSEAIQTHCTLLETLALAIERNIGVILATCFVDDLAHDHEMGTPSRLASCQCTPPRTILVQNAVLANAKILCDACRQPFTLSGSAG